MLQFPVHCKQNSPKTWIRSWSVSSNSFGIHLIQQQFTQLNYLGSTSCEFSQQTYSYKVRGEVDDHVSNSGFQHLWMGKRSTICKKVFILTKWSNLEAVQSKFRSTSRYCCSHMQTSEHFCCYQTNKRCLGPQDTWWLGWLIYMFWKACSCTGYTNSKKKNQKGRFSLKTPCSQPSGEKPTLHPPTSVESVALVFYWVEGQLFCAQGDFWWRKEILNILQGGTKKPSYKWGEITLRSATVTPMK